MLESPAHLPGTRTMSPSLGKGRREGGGEEEGVVLVVVLWRGGGGKGRG
jgi:hypothetical protein